MSTIYRAPGAASLAEDGPIFPVVVVGPAGQVRSHALVDTGSLVSSVDWRLLNQVGAIPGQMQPMRIVTGESVMLQKATGVALYAP